MSPLIHRIVTVPPPAAKDADFWFGLNALYGGRDAPGKIPMSVVVFA
jgi:hypothetical protein